MPLPLSTSPISPRRKLCRRSSSPPPPAASSSSSSSSSQTPAPAPGRCSIRECFKNLCRSRSTQATQSTSYSPPLDDLPPLPDSPASLALPASPDSTHEAKQPLIMLESATPQLSSAVEAPSVPLARSTGHSLAVNVEDALLSTSPTSLSMASPPPAMSPSVSDPSVTTLSPGRIRRRDTQDTEEDSWPLQLAETRSTSSSPLSIPRSSPGPEPYSNVPTHLGEAPIPFRTSFLPAPTNPLPALADRPAILPHLSRYTEQTEVMPADLPIYQHYRQVRRRTDVGPAGSSASGRDSRATSPNGDVPAPMPRRARSRQHTAGLRRDREREASIDRRAYTVTSGSSGPDGATSITPVGTASIVTPRGPPTPPPMFMAVHGLGQYPSAEAGMVPVPQSTSQSAPLASVTNPPTLGQQLTGSATSNSQTHYTTLDQGLASLVPINMTQSLPDRRSGTQANSAMPSVHHRQSPMTTLPPAQRMPTLFDWESPMYSDAQTHQSVPTGHIVHDPAFESRRLMLNQFAYYHDHRTLARLAHQFQQPQTGVAGPGTMPTRTESLYSRLARLDSLRSENPVYRGEISRPYMPVGESTSAGFSRRPIDDSHQPAHTSTAFAALDPVLPPIPPYAHDSIHRPSPSPWSNSNMVGSRWRSMGALSAVAGDLPRPAPEQRGVSEEAVDSYQEHDHHLSAHSRPDMEERDIRQRGGMLSGGRSMAVPSMGAWDLLPHFPIDTLDSGFHDPMHPTALNHIHPFARSRDPEHGPASTHSYSAPDATRFRLPEGLGDTHHDPEMERLADDIRWGMDPQLPHNMYPIPPPPTLVHSSAGETGPGAAAFVVDSGLGAGTQVVEDDYPTFAPRQHYPHQRMGRFVPLHSQIPTIAPRVLSPAFLRHYRIDKNWPIEKQKHIVRVVVRLLNGFTPVHKKLEAQSVLKYVSWEEMDDVCAAKGMEKETTCAVCYDEYTEGDKVAVTPCNHMYHKHCINTWFDTPMSVTSSAPTSCPMCRRNLAALALITRIVWSKDMEDALPLWMDTTNHGHGFEGRALLPE